MADETITDDRTTKDRATDVATTARDEARAVSRATFAVRRPPWSPRPGPRRVPSPTRRGPPCANRRPTVRPVPPVRSISWPDRLRGLADGNTEQAGDLQRYARDLGDRLGGVAGRMQDRGLDGMVDDVQDFARRRPGLFLAAAAGAGFAAGRLFRGAKADAESSGDGTGTSANGHGVGSELPAAGSPGTTAGGLAASSEGAAGGPTTALRSIRVRSRGRRSTSSSARPS